MQNENTAAGFNGKLLPVRLELFRAAYPFKEGWAVVTSNQLSTITLYDHNGQGFSSVLFTAELRKGGEVVATASTLRPLDGYKSWECGETNARSRLLEILGFGREFTDIEEAMELAEFEARKQKAMASVGPSPVTTTSAKFTVPAASVASASASADTNASATPQEPSRFAATKVVQRKVRTETSASTSGVPEYLRTQIVHRCGIAGIPVPVLNNEAQAKAILKGLLDTKAAS